MGLIAAADRFGTGLRRTMQDASDPSPNVNQFRARDAYHAVLRSYYANTVYENGAFWEAYKSRYRLPKALRSIFNPTRRAVDFYAGAVYPGAWTEDGKPSPSGRPSAMRFPNDVLEQRPDLVAAAIQGLAWGNWQGERNVYVREGATVGSVFVEIVDNLERGIVAPQIVDLTELADLDLDEAGNVKRYVVEYRTTDPDTGVDYTFRREVGPRIIEYRDEAVVRDESNPYGFAPAAWVRHRHVGGLFGASPIDGVIPKIDEANRLATALHNYVAQLQKQPTIFWSKSSPAPISTALRKQAAVLNDQQAALAEMQAASIDEQVLWLWSSDPNGKTSNLMQPVPVGDAAAELGRLLEEISDDLPEVVVSKELRAIPNLTGPGAERIVGDAATRLYEAQTNYDAGSVKIMQMTVAIGGWRANDGAWGSDLTRQQQKFLPFGLDSYKAGDLDMALLERPLFEPTDIERMNALTLKKAVAGLPDEEIQRELGYNPTQIAAFKAAAPPAPSF